MKLLQVFVLVTVLMALCQGFGCAASRGEKPQADPTPAERVTPVQVVQPAVPAASPATTGRVGFVATILDYLKSGIEIVLAAAVVFVWLTFGWVVAASMVVSVVVLAWPVAIGSVIAFGSLMLNRYAVPYTAFVNRILSRVWPWIKAVVAFVLRILSWKPGTAK